MRRIVYCSQSTHDFTPDELVDLLGTSRDNNERDGLSGMLLYSSQSFLQLLEGGDAAIRSTYERIAADPRHMNLRKLADIDVPAPTFPDWTMGFEHVDDEELADDLDGFTPATLYPLVNPDLITNAGVATTLLGLYAKNRVR
ncbi:BLUF domain-containing protein [uncultured Jatrophihabitans sp.]|uniref:BLUF domain-containing protein n=1 Tax=uncultured Jatrophihabitans sp. TaxID=1610747 RepID=UPI0035CC69A0